MSGDGSAPISIKKSWIIRLTLIWSTQNLPDFFLSRSNLSFLWFFAFVLNQNPVRLKLVHILRIFLLNPNVHVQKKISFWSERDREESQQAADNAIGTPASLCPGSLCQTAFCVPRIPVPCQSVPSLTPYVAKYLCVRVHEEGVLIPPLWSQSFRCLFPSPSFPTSHLRLARLCWAQVSQSSAEGQTDFTVVGKRVMCLTGAGELHS